MVVKKTGRYCRNCKAEVIHQPDQLNKAISVTGLSEIYFKCPQCAQIVKKRETMNTEAYLQKRIIELELNLQQQVADLVAENLLRKQEIADLEQRVTAIEHGTLQVTKI